MDTPALADNNSVFESFPEYNNFPTPWNLSELDTPAQPDCREQSAQTAQSRAADSAAAETYLTAGEAYPVFSQDPFPKLRTFPVYWDLSR
jgi:hypothetical protein